MSTHLKLALVLLALCLNACGNGNGRNSDDNSTPVAVSFSAEVQPIFDANCVTCHTLGGMAQFLRLTSAESYNALVSQPSQFTVGGTTLVVPSSSATSVLYMRVSGTGLSPSDEQMPRGAPALSSSDQEIIRNWIDEGASNN